MGASNRSSHTQGMGASIEGFKNTPFWCQTGTLGPLTGARPPLLGAILAHFEPSGSLLGAIWGQKGSLGAAFESQLVLSGLQGCLFGALWCFWSWVSRNCVVLWPQFRLGSCILRPQHCLLEKGWNVHLCTHSILSAHSLLCAL